MKKLYLNLKQGEIRVKIESTDDLWVLSQVIDEKDIAKAKTERKIKLGKDEERTKTAKKIVFISLELEKIEFSETNLRLSGKIVEEKEGIPKGSYHTINLEQGDEITIIKKEWLSYQLNKIKDACSLKISKTLICVFDRENAFFALLKKSGYNFLSEIQGEVQKKNADVKSSNFYNQIIKALEEYDLRYGLDHIIIATPAFWKEELIKELNNDVLKKKIILARCSSAGKEAFNEVMKRKEVESVLVQDKTSKELKIIDKVLEEIRNQGKVAYGLKETEQAVNVGAAEQLVLTENLIKKKRESNEFKILENLMKTTEKLKGVVHIINSNNDAGKKLDSLGGVAVLLRYKLNY